MGVAIIGYACVAPLWFAFHLWTSSTVTNPKDYQLFVDSPIKIALVPLSILTGFGLPSLLMSLPAPNLISFELKQTFTGIQQGWSIWIGLTQLTLTSIALTVDQRASILTEKDKKLKTVHYLKLAYTFAILSSAGSHLGALSVTGIAYLFPGLFSAKYAEQLQPQRVFVPVVPFGGPQVKTLADGALPFLQWDIIVGVSAALLWALTLHSSVRQEKATSAQTLFGTIKVALSTALLGPCGSAAIAVWSRDALVLGHSTVQDKKGKTL